MQCSAAAATERFLRTLHLHLRRTGSRGRVFLIYNAFLSRVDTVHIRRRRYGGVYMYTWGILHAREMYTRECNIYAYTVCVIYARVYLYVLYITRERFIFRNVIHCSECQ